MDRETKKGKDKMKTKTRHPDQSFIDYREGVRRAESRAINRAMLKMVTFGLSEILLTAYKNGANA
tara:strand:- start:484 stop:678 length:195 start_codon:yes stop_codon:yes gene_type:complete